MMMREIFRSKWKRSDPYLKLTTAQKVSFERNNTFAISPGPDFSCPGATEACKDCYATKNRHYFKNVMSAHYLNFVTMQEAMKDDDLYNNIVNDLYNKIKNKKIFRIHESGDFFSQGYINLWDNVIKECSETKFWTFTRSFNFDYSHILKNENFKLLASVDDYNKKEGLEFTEKYNILIGFGPVEFKPDKISDLIEDHKSSICPLTLKDHNYSKLRCSICGHCQNGKGNVVFIKH